MIARILRLVAVPIALATVAALFAPTPALAAVSAGDRARDVHWTFQGGATASAAERRRVDLRHVSARMTRSVVRVRLDVTEWVNACAPGVPCKSAMTFAADFRGRRVGWRVSIYAARWSSNSETRVDFFRADGSHSTKCAKGQVKLSTSKAGDHAVLVAPRWCFPKDRRLRSVMGWSAYSNNATVDGVHQYEVGQDYTDPARLDWVPNPS